MGMGLQEGWIILMARVMMVFCTTGRHLHVGKLQASDLLASGPLTFPNAKDYWAPFEATKE